MPEEHLSFAKARAEMIQERLNCLKFLEENNLYNYKRVNSVMESFWNDYNSYYEKLNEVGSRLEKMRFICSLPEMIEHIIKRMESNAYNYDYVNNEQEHDKMLIKKYSTYLAERGLDKDPQKIEKLKNDLVLWEQKYNSLSAMLKQKKDKLQEYEHYVEILKVSARGAREEYSHIWNEYAGIQSKGKEQENNSNTVSCSRRKKLGKTHDER